MGWSVGYDYGLKRDIGYLVPTYCEQPDCTAEISRGVGYACGGDHCVSAQTCGMYFCEAHLKYSYTPDGRDDLRDESGELYPARCERCVAGEEPFDVKKDHPTWMNWKLMHSSWGQWREENPREVSEYVTALAALGITPTPVDDDEESA